MSLTTLPHDVLYLLLQKAFEINHFTLCRLASTSKTLNAVYKLHESSLYGSELRAWLPRSSSAFDNALLAARHTLVRSYKDVGKQPPEEILKERLLREAFRTQAEILLFAHCTRALHIDACQRFMNSIDYRLELWREAGRTEWVEFHSGQTLPAIPSYEKWLETVYHYAAHGIFLTEEEKFYFTKQLEGNPNPNRIWLAKLLDLTAWETYEDFACSSEEYKGIFVGETWATRESPAWNAISTRIMAAGGWRDVIDLFCFTAYIQLKLVLMRLGSRFDQEKEDENDVNGKRVSAVTFCAEDFRQDAMAQWARDGKLGDQVFVDENFVDPFDDLSDEDGE